MVLVGMLLQERRKSIAAAECQAVIKEKDTMTQRLMVVLNKYVGNDV